MELVFAGLLVGRRMVDRRIGRNLPEVVPVIDFLVAEFIVGEVLANQPDIGLFVVELVLGRSEVPADATSRGVGRRGNLHASLGPVRVDSAGHRTDCRCGRGCRQGCGCAQREGKSDGQALIESFHDESPSVQNNMR